MARAQYTAEQKESWKKMRSLSASDLLAIMPEYLKDYTKLVGSWLWIEFDCKPEADVIAEVKSLGFTYNAKRNVWQNPCGKWSPHRHRNAPYDPRANYGEESVN